MVEKCYRIAEFIKKGYKLSKMLICLSGQHEMEFEFTGFRGFFTLNFIKKPIYNAYIMSSKLYGGLLPFECDAKNVFVIPTKDGHGNYAILLSYSDEFFSDGIETVKEKLSFDEELSESRLTVYRIDGGCNSIHGAKREIMAKPIHDASASIHQ